MIATKKELMGAFSDTIILLSLACNVHERLRLGCKQNHKFSILVVTPGSYDDGDSALTK